ncbi:toprim domain-containing protein [Paenisporosarcina cavernae]|uniref:Toprim domain-containing protein n=1 Tax=Paenisporosarcina cavernae TaxID=2320858 RepID=A0A385YU94_9BACL|nr:toprim domain-containing protein [Paenisporosarcina cavernae]AYC30051.1 hypothetical protein D3873_09255 [Paenisporosarcina cavernae]
MLIEKLLIVEGSSDKKRIVPLLAEPMEIICTNGTISPTRLEELLAPYDELELYVFVDADDSGEKIRKLFKRDYPEAFHLYTDPMYREVATTPLKVLASTLIHANIDVKAEFLN